MAELSTGWERRRRLLQRYAGVTIGIDGNGVADPLTDGLLFLRYLFGFRGATLIAGAVARRLHALRGRRDRGVPRRHLVDDEAAEPLGASRAGPGSSSDTSASMVRSPAVPPRSRVPDAARLLELIDGFAEQPILVLGDLVADRFIRGTPKRISREAPVLILRHDGEELVPGGGGNAVANLHALGGRPLPVGFVGDDEAGRALLDLFASRGIPIDGILVRRGYRTACKTRVLAGARHAIKQQVVRFDVEDPLPLSGAERAELERRLFERSTPLPRVRALGLRPRRRRSGARDGARGARRVWSASPTAATGSATCAASTAPRRTRRSSSRSKGRRGRSSHAGSACAPASTSASYCSRAAATA